MMNRRDFLAASSACVAMGASGLVADDADEPGIIDAHSHIWARDIKSYPLAEGMTLDDLKPPSFTTEELLELVRPHGVTRVVLIQHRPFHGVDNSYMLDSMKKYPGVFTAVACVDATQDDVTGEMTRLQKAGAGAFRITPSEDGTTPWTESDGVRAMWKHAGEHGMVICPLINPEHLPMADQMCEEYPDTSVVIDHFARIGGDGQIRESDLKNLAKLARHRHTHVKTSAFYAFGKKQAPYDDLIPMIRRLCDAYGPERLMWASDLPYQLNSDNTYPDSLALIQDRIDFLSPSDKQWLLRKTAARVYFGESDPA
ncbi:MAG: amidohydrolase family protein [Planctomycetaceae bacterium]|nr:amidohydrolase family protein [Planctomycetaceae bacterium]